MIWPYKQLAPIAVCICLTSIVLVITGCPAGQSSSDTDSASPPPTSASDDTAAPQRSRGTNAADSSTPPTADAPPADSPPPLNSIIAWELDGFHLGMSVPEARSRIQGEMQNYIQERWRYEGVTGVIVAGTYNDPIRMQGSLMFYDGELVAVVANKLQEQVTFNQKLAELGKSYGESRSVPPEFARGYRFIEAMAADERQPDRQYLWSEEASQTLLLAGYYSEDMLATYMLIDTRRYDLVAEAMQEVEAANQATPAPTD